MRLYRDGVFHSQYNPDKPVTGGVWDVLMLPALFYPAGQINNVLVLGVGGGAVLRLIGQFVSPGRITGVELDPVHIRIAKRFFGVSSKLVNLVEADAVQWLQNYQGEPFDMIIDDLFGEEDGEPIRAIEADLAWTETLLDHLSEQGVLVMNFMGKKALKEATPLANEKIRNSFPSIFQFTLPEYENAVAALFRRKVTANELAGHMQQFSDLDKSRKSCRLSYHLYKIQ